MSKTKARKVFKVSGTNGDTIVVARHAKGARTIAAEHIDGVTVMSRVEELSVHMKDRAVNRAAE